MHEIQKTINYLAVLLKEGRTEEVIKQTNAKFAEKNNDLLIAITDHCEDWFEERWPNTFTVELYSLRGMAHYRRKEFLSARTNFHLALDSDPENERALYGMAYLAAYVDKDPDRVREYMNRLPESPARDNAWVILARSRELVSLPMTEEYVDRAIERWTKPNPQDPLNVANLLHNAARFFMEVPKTNEEEHKGTV